MKAHRTAVIVLGALAVFAMGNPAQGQNCQALMHQVMTMGPGYGSPERAQAIANQYNAHCLGGGMSLGRNPAMGASVAGAVLGILGALGNDFMQQAPQVEVFPTPAPPNSGMPEGFNWNDPALQKALRELQNPTPYHPSPVSNQPIWCLAGASCPVGAYCGSSGQCVFEGPAFQPVRPSTHASTTSKASPIRSNNTAVGQFESPTPPAGLPGVVYTGMSSIPAAPGPPTVRYYGAPSISAR